MSAPKPPSHPTIIGNPSSSFWLFSPSTGYDLTHPSTPSSPPLQPRLTIPTTGPHAITIHPPSSALIIINMQNFFLSPLLGRPSDLADSPGLRAEKQLLERAIPAARKAGIQVVWLNWGLTQEDVREMPPVTVRCFGRDVYDAAEPEGTASPAEPSEKRKGLYAGLGNDLGTIQTTSTSANSGEASTIDAGRMFMRGSWNAALHGPLSDSYESSLSGPKPDVKMHKNRASGLAPSGSSCHEYLTSHGIKTLLFAGVNTDQCVLSSLADACFLGYDVVLLRDGCGTTSPGDAAEQVEHNVKGGWGSVGDCEGFKGGVEEMLGRG